MIVKLLAEHHLEFLSLKGGGTDSSESTLVKIPHCWKSHVAAYFLFSRTILDDLANFNRSTYTESCAGGNAAIPLLETLTKRIEALLSDLDSDLTSIIRGNEGNFKDIAKTFVYNHG